MGGGGRYLKQEKTLARLGAVFGIPPMTHLAKINFVYQQNLEKKKTISFLSQGHHRNINTSINLKQNS